MRRKVEEKIYVESERRRFSPVWHQQSKIEFESLERINATFWIGKKYSLLNERMVSIGEYHTSASF